MLPGQHWDAFCTPSMLQGTSPLQETETKPRSSTHFVICTSHKLLEWSKNYICINCFTDALPSFPTSRRYEHSKERIKNWHLSQCKESSWHTAKNQQISPCGPFFLPLKNIKNSSWSHTGVIKRKRLECWNIQSQTHIYKDWTVIAVAGTSRMSEQPSPMSKIQQDIYSRLSLFG